MFDSQTCEKTFRLFRSMGTMEYTKINFTLYDLLHMIGRVEVMNEIAYCNFKVNELRFPHVREGKSKIYDLPSDDINSTIEEAKQLAIQDASCFGMSTTNNIDKYEIHTRIFIDDSDEENEDEGRDEMNHVEDLSILDDDLNNISEAENSTLTSIIDEYGIERTVRKSTLIWMLTEPSEYLSKDRIRRFHQSNKKRKAN